MPLASSPVLGKVIRVDELLMGNGLLDVAHPVDMGSPHHGLVTSLAIAERDEEFGRHGVCLHRSRQNTRYGLLLRLPGNRDPIRARQVFDRIGSLICVVGIGAVKRDAKNIGAHAGIPGKSPEDLLRVHTIGRKIPFTCQISERSLDKRCNEGVRYCRVAVPALSGDANPLIELSQGGN